MHAPEVSSHRVVVASEPSDSVSPVVTVHIPVQRSVRSCRRGREPMRAAMTNIHYGMFARKPLLFLNLAVDF